MSARRRTLLLVALALAVPLPAFALTGEEGPPAGGPVSLGVSASLAGCGLAETEVVCEIAFSFEAVPGATSYTASVTSPGGSVTDVGSVGPGGGSAFVPYTGSGYYSVRVNAYGQPEEDGERKVIATDVSQEVDPEHEKEPAAEPEITPGHDPASATRDPEAPAAAEETGEPGSLDAPSPAEAPAAEPAECDPAPAPAPPEPEAPDTRAVEEPSPPQDAVRDAAEAADAPEPPAPAPPPPAAPCPAP